MQVLSMTNLRVLFGMGYSYLYENIINEVVLHVCNIANLIHDRTQNYKEILLLLLRDCTATALSNQFQLKQKGWQYDIK